MGLFELSMHLGGEGLAAEVKLSHFIHSQEAERRMLVPSLLSPLYSAQDSNPRDVLLAPIGDPSRVKPAWKRPPRHAQR